MKLETGRRSGSNGPTTVAHTVLRVTMKDGSETGTGTWTM